MQHDVIPQQLNFKCIFKKSEQDIVLLGKLTVEELGQNDYPKH